MIDFGRDYEHNDSVHPSPFFNSVSKFLNFKSTKHKQKKKMINKLLK